jgi:hypothetical protein
MGTLNSVLWGTALSSTSLDCIVEGPSVSEVSGKAVNKVNSDHSILCQFSLLNTVYKCRSC